MFDKIKLFYETRTGVIAILLLIFFVTVLFIGLIVNADVYGPMHFNDEIVYWQMALDLHEGNFSLTNHYDYPPFYPASLMPAFFLFSALERYAAVKWLHAIYIASTIFPAYLLLRKFTTRGISLLGVLVLMISPITLVIPRSVISENVFCPLLMWAVLLAFTNLAPERSRLRVLENVLFGVLLSLLMLTRYIALALVPGLLLIWWLKPFSDAKSALLISPRKVIHLGAVLLPLALIMGAWLLFGAGEGIALKEQLGFSIASSPNPAQLGKRRLLMWAVFYISYALLLCAPYLAVVLPSLFQFKLKRWQQDENRWWIALAIIMVCFLVPCIRHSWRVAYNYPDPVKLQGRYILYFAPLFLISAFGYLQKMALKRGLTEKVIVLLLCVGLIVFGYAILFEGVIFLDGGQLGPAVNAPYGSMMRTMQWTYPAAALLITLVITLLAGRHPKLALVILTILLVGFYSYGSVRVHKRLLTSRQLLNAQVYSLVQLAGSTAGEEWDRIHDPVVLNVPSSSTARYARSWQQTLNFNGYLNNSVVINEALDQIPNLIFEAEINASKYRLIELDADSYAESENPKFKHSIKFYEFVPVFD